MKTTHKTNNIWKYAPVGGFCCCLSHQQLSKALSPISEASLFPLQAQGEGQVGNVGEPAALPYIPNPASNIMEQLKSKGLFDSFCWVSLAIIDRITSQVVDKTKPHIQATDPKSNSWVSDDPETKQLCWNPLLSPRARILQPHSRTCPKNIPGTFRKLYLINGEEVHPCSITAQLQLAGKGQWIQNVYLDWGAVSEDHRSGNKSDSGKVVPVCPCHLISMSKCMIPNTHYRV